MNKKILIPIIALLLVLLGVLAYLKVFSHTSDTNENTNEISDNLLIPTAAADLYEDSNRLEISEGSVKIKRASGEEEEINDETTVSVGDTIKVSDDGKATLYWFDDSISRLSAGTEITIDKADYNPDNLNETNVNFKVVSGKVWSKVQAIVDEDSEFLGYVGAVVAGVRGSVFNISVEGDEVVFDSVEHALMIGDDVLTSGERARFHLRGGDKISRGDIPDEEWGKQWFKENSDSDKQDHDRMMQLMLRRLKKTLGALPGENGFEERMNRLDRFMKSDADPAKKMRVKAKIIALIRALDVLPNDKLFEIRQRLEDKLIEWEPNEKRRTFMMRKIFERRLFILHDWLKNHDPSPEEIKNFLEQFHIILDENGDFFLRNPGFIRLVKGIIHQIKEKMPEILDEIDFLEKLKEIYDEDHKEVQKFIKRRDLPIRPRKVEIKKDPQLPLKEVQNPPMTHEPEEIIEKEAPYHQGESNV